MALQRWRVDSVLQSIQHQLILDRARQMALVLALRTLQTWILSPSCLVAPGLRELEGDQLLRQTTEVRVIIARKEPYPPSVRASPVATELSHPLHRADASLNRSQAVELPP